MRKPRIVHMVEAFDKTGGPPKLVRTIIDSSLQEKYDFYILSYSITGLDIKAIMNLKRKLTTLSPAIVHIHGLKTDGFHAAVAARLSRVKKILVTVHGSTADAITQYQTPQQKLRRWIVGQILEPATLRMVDAVYCVCDAMTNRARIKKHAGKRLKETIHNGIVPVPSPSRNISSRKNFGFSDSDIVLLYTGRIVKDKGLEVLAVAMQQIMSVNHGYKKIKLLLVGDGDEFSQIRSCFQNLIQSNCVVMAGKREDITKINAMSDIFIFPSFAENLSFSLLEAMDAGIPIIATAVGGNLEIVVDGETGLLVPSHDPDALAQCILKLAADKALRVKMGLAGKSRLEEYFSADVLTRKTDALYQFLLKKLIT